MTHSPKRRTLLLTALTAPLASACTPLLKTQTPPPNPLQQQLTELEQSANGRLGLYAINTANSTTYHYRPNERFPFCSTFKTIVAAAILKKDMAEPQLLQQRIHYTQSDLVSWSPITQQHLHNGMTIAQLCAAALQYSDNTATNLLIKHLGNPQTITQFARSIGDTTFRLDRWEPQLNSAIPGDERDTTTPAAMANTLHQLTLGNTLAPPQRQQLQHWLKGNTTGDKRIRASAPKDWIIADKTGGGDYGTTNDIAILWPPNAAPIILAIYFTQTNQDATAREDVIATATHLLLNQLT